VALNTIPPPPNLRKEERNQDKVKESMFLKILVEGLLFHFLPKWKQIILRIKKWQMPKELYILESDLK
jgi:hypothetical protein